jgi:hypothetical protein
MAAVLQPAFINLFAGFVSLSDCDPFNALLDACNSHPPVCCDGLKVTHPTFDFV